MSKSFVRVNAHNIQELNDVPTGTIVAVLDPNTSVTDDNVEAMVLPCFDDPRVGFVFTDMFVKDNGMEIVEYMDGVGLPNFSFFMRKVDGLKLEQADNTKTSIMQQLIQKGFYFEHVADPIVLLEV